MNCDIVSSEDRDQNCHKGTLDSRLERAKQLLSNPQIKNLSGDDLGTLAEAVNQFQRAGTKALVRGLQLYRQAGELLLEMKERLGHGEFNDWVMKHCDFDPRTARRYMQLARRWEQLQEEHGEELGSMSLTSIVTRPRKSRTNSEAATAPPSSQTDESDSETILRERLASGVNSLCALCRRADEMVTFLLDTMDQYEDNHVEDDERPEGVDVERLLTFQEKFDFLMTKLSRFTDRRQPKCESSSPRVPRLREEQDDVIDEPSNQSGNARSIDITVPSETNPVHLQETTSSRNTSPGIAEEGSEIPSKEVGPAHAIAAGTENREPRPKGIISRTGTIGQRPLRPIVKENPQPR